MATRHEALPAEIFTDKPMSEFVAIAGRWSIMKALGLNFTHEKMVQIARNEMVGYEFVGAVRKTWSGITGNPNGLLIADIENEAQALGIYEDVLGYDY